MAFVDFETPMGFSDEFLLRFFSIYPLKLRGKDLDI